MNQKLNSVQVLRGLAALSVVLFHYRFWLAPLYGDLTLVNKYLSWGSAGVDLFFVISGFIMIHITNSKPSGIKSSIFFFVERLIRILPTYILGLLTAFYFTWEVGIFSDAVKLENLMSALTFMPYTENYPPLYINADGLFVVRWTLNYELYFYLVFSICLLFSRRQVVIFIWLLLTAAFGYSFANEITLSTSGYKTGNPIFSFLTNPIVFEFALGIAAGYTYISSEKWSKKWKAIFTLVAALVFAIAAFNGAIEGYSLKTGVVAYFVLVAFIINDEFISRISPKFFIMLGNISFSWYLLHNQFGSYFSWQVEANNPGVMHGTNGFFIMLVASIFVAWLSHKYVEGILTSNIRDKIFSTRFGKLIDMRKNRKYPNESMAGGAGLGVVAKS